MKSKHTYIAALFAVSAMIQSCSTARNTAGTPGSNLPPGPISPTQVVGPQGTVGTVSASNVSNTPIPEPIKIDTSLKINGDVSFVQQTILNNSREIYLAGLAAKNSQDSDVKAYGTMVAKDHNAANTELLKIAKSKNILIPEQNQPAADALSNLTGAEFDKVFLQTMVDEHKKAVNLLEMGAKSADPELKAYAKMYLPTVKEHIKQIKSLKK
ncbi:DUF4142 domain-containing protein [Pedobacter metabolipauper]|uniref:Putative outer membrane protein n=1 Tax=Pedobacter metabolipauper TaxID=425513 RepID=A0A4R6SZ48_9SPHI|nr:DUF4142 domain-containing protein [Pedobacter metabolipauper]TDQ10012.1 putative outer membrane protein [Pedobacter metabolipauper]